MRVDLPDPDGPMMVVKRPRSKSTFTSFNAVTAVIPRPYTFTACSARAAMAPAVAAVGLTIWAMTRP
jgi:hypothetical protein